MPRCLECDESYADKLRRCPHCGAVALSHQEEGGDGLPAPSAEPARMSSGVRLRAAPYATILAITAGVILLAVAGVVFHAGAEKARLAEPVLVSAAGGAGSTLPGEAGQSLPPIRPDPPEMWMEDLFAVRAADGIVVGGRCSPNGVVRVLVNGRSAVLSPAGDSFRLVVPDDGAGLEVVAEGIEGGDVRQAVPAPEPDLRPPGRHGAVRITNFADGATVHEDKVWLEVGSVIGSSARLAEIELAEVENRIQLGDTVFTLFRAPEGLVYLRRTAGGHETFLREADGQEMVLVPGGLSWRGSGEQPPDGPRHIVRLRPFLIDRTEVTCLQYAGFLDYMGRADDGSVRHPEDPGVELRPLQWTDANPPPGWDDLPVSGVSWFAAAAYARWVGGRLATEAEWERAAAGPSGLAYPWGDSLDVRRCRTDSAGPLPADSLPGGSGFFGLLHTSGNVREWCEDRFDPRWYLRSSRVNPRGPSSFRHRVVRGGSFASPADALRNQQRDQADPHERLPDVGFRVAMRWPLSASSEE